MKKSFILHVLSGLGIAMLSFSCTKRPNDPIVIDTTVDLKYVNSEAIDILNETYIKDLKVFHLVEGKLLSPDLSKGHEMGFLLYKDLKGQNILRIFPFQPPGKDTTITILKFNNTVQDTLTSYLSHEKNTVICTKAFYNGNLEWYSGDPVKPERILTIIK